ncbi:hypothetical protein C2E31_17515 [Rhodopirellula baltica]|nr:hypothetical protein C2E31_17515 [Rhodopirellula baltica]
MSFKDLCFDIVFEENRCGRIKTDRVPCHLDKVTDEQIDLRFRKNRSGRIPEFDVVVLVDVVGVPGKHVDC